MILFIGWTKADSRPSAIGVGSMFGAIFMTVFGLLIVCLDLTLLKPMIKKGWAKLKKAIHKLRIPNKINNNKTEVMPMNNLNIDVIEDNVINRN